MITPFTTVHNGRIYRIEIDDYDDGESGDTVTVFDDNGGEITSYDSSANSDDAKLDEARAEIAAIVSGQ